MRGRQSACCFTGHRPAKLPWGYREEDLRCLDLKRRMADAVEAAYAEGYRHFLCGMAMGCDLYFCECVLALREAHPDVTVEAAIPCPTQADAWPADQRGAVPAAGRGVRLRNAGVSAVHVLVHAAAGPLHGRSRLAADRRL